MKPKLKLKLKLKIELNLNLKLELELPLKLATTQPVNWSIDHWPMGQAVKRSSGQAVKR